MDDDLTGSFRAAIAAAPPDAGYPEGVRLETEWTGTGMCAQAQADGVPCFKAGRSCDICGKAATEVFAR